jgi:hypothetical protein
MKKRFIFIFAVYIFLIVSGSIYGIGERTILLGGDATWISAEQRTGIAEVNAVRPNPVLILCSSTGVTAAGYSAASGVSGNFAAMTEPALDMSVSFDEREPGLFRDSAGNYRVIASQGVEAADRAFSRAGTGAALFGSEPSSSTNPIVIEPNRSGALFSGGSRIRDFTIEFWMYPVNLENGEQMLSWIASRRTGGNYSVQRIMCVASKNRLMWTFENFFSSPGDSSQINIELSGSTPVVPKTWSHHLIRFDAESGMIEYLVDGKSETIVYATSTGRENSEVYTPVAGNGGVFVIGGIFSGLLDELKIHSVCAGRSSMQRYASAGGRIQTRTIDLGDYNSGVLRIEACGGRTGVKAVRISNEFRENGRFRFPDDSEMNFFVRAADHPYRLSESAWKNFVPGTDITGEIRGRYVQVAVDFYPSADGETSPYLDELRIIYQPGEPPMPPVNLTASAFDGGVLLQWKKSPDVYSTGYLVYYSAVRGELFGEGASIGPSPVDVGNRNSVLIEGLRNGTLYYFRVASYTSTTNPDSPALNVGEFSREVTARPLMGLALDDH